MKRNSAGMGRGVAGEIPAPMELYHRKKKKRKRKKSLNRQIEKGGETMKTVK